jgi:hypothetical protein
MNISALLAIFRVNGFVGIKVSAHKMEISAGDAA